MTVRSCLAAAVMGLCLAQASQAFAIPVVGSSSGSFSNLTGCDDKGSDRECGIAGSGNGADTQVRWPYLKDKKKIDNASRLTSVDVEIEAADDADDVVIARLDWYNAATSSRITPDSLGVTWTLTISFTHPNLSVDTEAFGLTIANPTNPAGDTISGFTLADLANLSFDLDGLMISDFRYSVLDGAGHCSGQDTYITGTSWYNCEYNNASLLITADFTARGDGNDFRSGAIPEPATLAVLGAGLMGLATIRRRKAA